MTAPAAGLVEVEGLVRFSAFLVRFTCVRTQLPWVFGEITAPIEEQLGPPTVDGKSEQKRAGKAHGDYRKAARKLELSPSSGHRARGIDQGTGGYARGLGFVSGPA